VSVCVFFVLHSLSAEASVWRCGTECGGRAVVVVERGVLMLIGGLGEPVVQDCVDWEA